MELLRRVNTSNEAYLIHSTLGGQIVLRLACGGLEQCAEDIDVVWKVIGKEAAGVLARCQDAPSLLARAEEEAVAGVGALEAAKPSKCNDELLDGVKSDHGDDLS